MSCCIAKTKIMDNENYEPSELLKTLQGLLKNYCFKLEGLSDECERSFIHIIKHLGAKISKSSKYTLVEKSYFDKDENKNRKDLYHLCFILDCIDHRKVLNIESYRCNKPSDTNKENSPVVLQNKSKNVNDNLGNITDGTNLSNRSKADNLPVQKTVMQSKLQNNHETLKKDISNSKGKKSFDNRSSNNDRIRDISSKNNVVSETDSDDDVPISERISNSILKNNNQVSKKDISNTKANKPFEGRSSDNSRIGDISSKNSSKNNFVSETDSDDDVPISQRISHSKSQDNKILKKNISNANAKRSCNDTRFGCDNDNGNISDASTITNLCNKSNSDDDAPMSQRRSYPKLQNNKILKKNISNANAKRSCNDTRSGCDNGNGNISDASTISNLSNKDEDAPITERISHSKLQDNNKILKKNISNANAKRSCNDTQSDSDNDNIDDGNISDASTRSNLSNKSNSDEDILVSKVIKNSTSQNNNKTINNAKDKKSKIYHNPTSNRESSTCNEPVKIKSEPKSSDSSTLSPELTTNNSKNKKRKISATTTSDSESSSSESVKIKSEPKTSDSSEDDSSSSSNRLSQKKKVSVKREAPITSSESDNSESDSESSKRKKRKKVSDSEVQKNLQKPVSQNKTNSNAGRSAWVNTKHLQNSKNKSNKDNNEEEAPSNSRVDWTKSKIEERKDLKWLFDVDENNLCQVRKCTFEPGPHTSHDKRRRMISEEEKHIILKYLIKNKYIPLAKGIRTWEIMIGDGYLTHRAPETLRNCLRRTMLPAICSFGLPVDILDQFLYLDETKEKGHKSYAQVKKGMVLN